MHRTASYHVMSSISGRAGAGLRFSIAAVMALAILTTSLPARTAGAANVGSCASVTRFNGVAEGTIQFSGQPQCFSIYLDAGYHYTITINPGDSSYTSSSDPRLPLGDSVLHVYKSKFPGLSVTDPYNANAFELVGWNDDFAPQIHLGSRVGFEVPSSGSLFPQRTHYVARVTGYGNAVGTFTIEITRSVFADIDACDHYFACQ